MGLLSNVRYKFAEVHMPLRAKELAFCVKSKKKVWYTDAGTERGPSIVELTTTHRTNPFCWAMCRSGTL